MQNKPTKPIILIIILLIVGAGAYFLNVSNKSDTVQTPTTQNTITIGEPNPSTPKTYTLAEVSQHKTENDCWTAVNGGVYDLSPFVHSHPGGVPNITKLCGIDGTTIFTAQHSGQEAPEAELASLKIGVLIK